MNEATLQRMRELFDQLRPARDDWPATFDEAMRVPLLRSVLHVMLHNPEAAIERARMRCALPARDLQVSPEFESTTPDITLGDPVPVNRPYVSHTEKRRAWNGLDFKSRAAGEKPEPD